MELDYSKYGAWQETKVDGNKVWVLLIRFPFPKPYDGKDGFGVALSVAERETIDGTLETLPKDVCLLKFDDAVQSLSACIDTSRRMGEIV